MTQWACSHVVFFIFVDGIATVYISNVLRVALLNGCRFSVHKMFVGYWKTWVWSSSRYCRYLWFFNVRRVCGLLSFFIGWQRYRCWHRWHTGCNGSEEDKVFVPRAAGGMWCLLVSVHFTWTLWSVSPLIIHCFPHLMNLGTKPVTVSISSMDLISNIFFPDICPAGILNDDGTLNNDASCLRLAEVAVSYAQAGKSCYLKLVSVWGAQPLKGQLCFYSDVVHVDRISTNCTDLYN